jgi:arginyl-tRNA synthetase
MARSHAERSVFTRGGGDEGADRSAYKVIKEKLKSLIENAIEAATKDKKFSELSSPSVQPVIEKPRSVEHGDFACGIALKLAGPLKSPPVQIAETLANYIRIDAEAAHLVANLNVAAPGYLNFALDKRLFCSVLNQIHTDKERYGHGENPGGGKILLEYVSANPTGELHIGHGRGAVYGSCLANLFKFAGYDVTQEFYVNDTGEQMLQFGRCARALYQSHFGREAPYPEEGYPAFLLSDFVKEVATKRGDKFLALSGDDASLVLGRETADAIIEHQRALLDQIGVHFDVWFSERSLHESGEVDEVLAVFKEKGASYEEDGALWLKAKERGDERDRVLRKSTGNTTYLANDAAYHLDKLKRGFSHLINIWGADHHGQIPGIKASIAALGYDSDVLEVILTQIVNLSRDGKLVRMSKRAGTVVTLAEVVEEVGVDAVRYYLAETNPQNPINFDLELAKKTGRENPAFYIQYAHARCCSILRKALEESESENGNAQSQVVTSEQWQKYQALYQSDPSVFEAIFDADPAIYNDQKALVMRLEAFPEEVKESVQLRLPGRIARYAYDVANDLQKFYEVSRVITDDPIVTRARLGLIDATRQVLFNALSIIGVSAPERM